jgi:protein arginine N-methyltransferase 1
MSKPTGYSVRSYGDMITNEPRMPAYDAALRRAVTPGCTVIDIGAGTGIFSLLACKYGAGHVYAIEPADEIELLRTLAAANGCADRITIVHDLSTAWQPPRRAEVIVSDCRGILPLFEHHIATIADARARLLAPGGTLIPQRDTLRLALASNPEAHHAIRRPWHENAWELDLSAGYGYAANEWSKVNLAPEQLLSEPATLAVLDYTSITDPDLSATATLAVTAAGTAHGLLLWFDAELAPGIGFSNAPGQPKLVYGQTFLPLQEPLTLAPGDTVEAGLSAKLIDGSYVWAWNTRLFRAGMTEAEIAQRQSSFLATVMSPRTLARRADSHVPPADPKMEIDRQCLSLVDGKRSLGGIAAELAGRFPQHFTSAKAALDHVARLLNRY